MNDAKLNKKVLKRLSIKIIGYSLIITNIFVLSKSALEVCNNKAFACSAI